MHLTATYTCEALSGATTSCSMLGVSPASVGECYHMCTVVDVGDCRAVGRCVSWVSSEWGKLWGMYTTKVEKGCLPEG